MRRAPSCLLIGGLALVLSACMVEKRIDTGKIIPVDLHVHFFGPPAETGKWPDEIIALAQPIPCSTDASAEAVVLFPRIYVYRDDLGKNEPILIGPAKDITAYHQQLVHRYQTAGISGWFRKFYSQSPGVHDLKQFVRADITGTKPPADLSSPRGTSLTAKVRHADTTAWVLSPKAPATERDRTESASVVSASEQQHNVFSSSDALLNAIGKDVARRLAEGPAESIQPSFVILYEPPDPNAPESEQPPTSTSTHAPDTEVTVTSTIAVDEREDHHDLAATIEVRNEEIGRQHAQPARDALVARTIEEYASAASDDPFALYSLSKTVIYGDEHHEAFELLERASKLAIAQGKAAELSRRITADIDRDLLRADRRDRTIWRLSTPDHRKHWLPIVDALARNDARALERESHH